MAEEPQISIFCESKPKSLAKKIRDGRWVVLYINGIIFVNYVDQLIAVDKGRSDELLLGKYNVCWLTNSLYTDK